MPTTIGAGRNAVFAPLDDGAGRSAAVVRRLGSAIALGLLADGEQLPAEAELATSLGVTVIDPLPWMCLDTKCPIVIGNVLVYRDNHHITQPFSRLVAPMLDAQLPALGP